MSLQVYYGFRKLTKKAIRKVEFSVVFENGSTARNEKSIERNYHVAYVRRQSKGEMQDSKSTNRMFTCYSYFLKDKRWGGCIDKVLDFNYKSDSNNVSEKIRREIRIACRKMFFDLDLDKHPDCEVKNKQLELF